MPRLARLTLVLLIVLATAGAPQVARIAAAPAPAPAAVPWNGVPSLPINYAQDVEVWWAAHPFNRQSGSFNPAITSPSPTTNLAAGGNIQAAIDGLPGGGGTIQLASGNYTSNFSLIARSNVHILGVSGSVIHVADSNSYVRVYGCSLADDYAAISSGVASGDPTARTCVTSGKIHNVMFSNITFDGGNVAEQAFLVRAATDIMFDNLTFDHFVDPHVSHPGIIEGSVVIDNIWVRNSHFVCCERYPVYFDGMHGGGVIDSRIENTFSGGGSLFLTNDDFTRDYDSSGTITIDEQRTANHDVVAGNSYAGGIYDFLSTTGRDILVTKNVADAGLVTGAVFDAKSSHVASNVVYNYTGNRVVGNTTNGSLVSLAQVKASPDCPMTVNCSLQGQYQVRDNIVTSSNYQQAVIEQATSFGSIGTPNVVSGNCINNPGCITNPTPTPGAGTATPTPVPPTATTGPTATPIPGGANLLVNGDMETGGTFPTFWQQRDSGSFDTTVKHGGAQSLKVVGPADTYSFQGVTLAPSTTYTLSVWVKTDAIAANGVRTRYVQLDPSTAVLGDSDTISGTADWQQITVTFATGAGYLDGRVDLLWHIASGETAWFDDVSLVAGAAPTPTPTVGPGTPTPTTVPTAVPTATPGVPGGPLFPIGAFEDGNMTFGDPAAYSAMVTNLQSHFMNSVYFTNNNTGRDTGMLSSTDGQPGWNVFFNPAAELNTTYWPSGVAATIANARSAIYPVVDQLKPHASVKGFAFKDEPDNSDQAKVALAVQAFTERDAGRPNFPTLIGINRGDVIFNAAQPPVDVLDVYPIGSINPPCDYTMTGFGYTTYDFSSYVRTMVAQKPQGTPLWIILQTHNWGTPGQLYALRVPSVPEIRAQHWMAIGEGATGIFWFVYSSQQGWAGLADAPTLFNATGALAQRTLPLESTLLTTHRVADQFTVTGSNSPYVSTLLSADGLHRYAVVVNKGFCTDGSSTSLQVQAPGQSGVLRDLETGQQYTQGSLISFPAGDGKIFELVSGAIPTPTPLPTATPAPTAVLPGCKVSANLNGTPTTFTRPPQFCADQPFSQP